MDYVQTMHPNKAKATQGKQENKNQIFRKEGLIVAVPNLGMAQNTRLQAYRCITLEQIKCPMGVQKHTLMLCSRFFGLEI